MVGKSPGSQIPKKVEFRRQVNLAFISRVTEHSGALRLKLPRSEAQFYEIQPGDVCHVVVDVVKGERDAPTAKSLTSFD